MSTAGFFIAYFNNSKKNPLNLGKNNKINNLKINIIINNTAKAKKDDNPNFLNNKNNPKRENKRGGKFYNKKNNNKNKKIRVAKPNKYYKKREKFKPWLF